MSVTLRGKTYWTDFVVRGERIQQDTGETNERKAKLAEGALRAEVKARQKDGHRRITLGEALERYAATVIAAGHTSLPDTKVGNTEERIYRLIAARFGPDTMLDDITGPKIAAWRDGMLAGGVTKPISGGKRGEKQRDAKVGLKPGSVNRYLAALRAVLKKANGDWGCLRVMPRFDQARMPKGKPINWLEKKADQDALLLASPEHFRPYVMFLLGTGARSSEAVNLTWDDLDISENRPDAEVTFPKTKNGEARVVPLPAPTRAMLLKMRAAKPDGEPRVFLWADPAQGYKRVPFNNPKVTMRSVTRRAGLKGVTLHTLRHTYACRLVKGRVPLMAVQKLLGHASIKMTEHYAKLAPSTLGSEVTVLDGILAA
jgi:integrase